jgi:hypothetical protein
VCSDGSTPQFFHARLRAVDNARAQSIQKTVDAAAVFAATRDFAKAFAYLDQASKTLKQLITSSSPKTAANSVPSGNVTARKSTLAQAQATREGGVRMAVASVKPIQATLKVEYAAAGRYLDSILDSYRNQLSTLLQAAQAVQDQPSMDAAVKRVSARLQQLRAEIAGDALFAYLARHGVKVRQAFDTALDQVQALL